MVYNPKNIGREEKYIVMGVLNITPDSFYDGGKFYNTENAIAQLHKLIDEGADIIDVGGQSTRPGHKKISVPEEILRIEPIIQYLRDKYPHILLSIDSFYHEVINHVSKYKIDIINSVAGGKISDEMITAILNSGGSYVITSHENNIEDMVENIEYQIRSLKNHGINKIIIDPGFGFGKTREQNYEVLSSMKKLEKWNFPILVGISRKSMIYKTLDILPQEALNGTTVIHTLALMNGARILRVHDIKEAKETIKLFETYEQNFIGI